MEIWNGYISETIHVRPQVSKAKMCLRSGSFSWKMVIFLGKKVKYLKNDSILHQSSWSSG